MSFDRRFPTLTPAQMRNRRLRNVAIALCVGGLAALFYALTIVRMGPGMFHGPG
jgi:hypothetical protein